MNCDLGCVTLFHLLSGYSLSCFGFLDLACSFFVFFPSLALPCLSLRLCAQFLGKARYFFAASVWPCHMQGCCMIHTVFCYFMHFGDLSSGSLHQDEPVWK